jgi:hypothetical protein
VLVGVAGFEPATPSSRTRCATSHTPISLVRPHYALRRGHDHDRHTALKWAARGPVSHGRPPRGRWHRPRRVAHGEAATGVRIEGSPGSLAGAPEAGRRSVGGEHPGPESAPSGFRQASWGVSEPAPARGRTRRETASAPPWPSISALAANTLNELHFWWSPLGRTQSTSDGTRNPQNVASNVAKWVFAERFCEGPLNVSY